MIARCGGRFKLGGSGVFFHFPHNAYLDITQCMTVVTLVKTLGILLFIFFFFQAEDGIRDTSVTGVQTCALPISMLQMAVKWLVDTRSGAAEIWIGADLQESNWAPEDGRWKSALDQFRALPQKVRFRILSFESAGEANTSISLAEIPRRDRGGQASLAYVLDLQRVKASNETIPITIMTGGARMQTEVKSEGTSIRWRSALALDASRPTG